MITGRLGALFVVSVSRCEFSHKLIAWYAWKVQAIFLQSDPPNKKPRPGGQGLGWFAYRMSLAPSRL